MLRLLPLLTSIPATLRISMYYLLRNSQANVVAQSIYSRDGNVTLQWVYVQCHVADGENVMSPMEKTCNPNKNSNQNPVRKEEPQHPPCSATLLLLRHRLSLFLGFHFCCLHDLLKFSYYSDTKHKCPKSLRY